MLRACPPRLLDYVGEVMLKLPENFKELEADEQDRFSHQVTSSILLYIYETKTAKLNPPLNRVLRLEHGKTLTELVDFAADTWDDDILPFRECLIRVER